MSLLDLEDTQSRVGSSITQDQIDEAEDWLARQPNMGPLIGERTESFFLSEVRPLWYHAMRDIDGIWLSRRTDSVILTSTTNDDDTLLVRDTDYRLYNGLFIERIPNSETWGDTLTATYTPNDEEIVRSALYDVLSYAQTPSGIQSIRIGQYSETYFPGGSESSQVLGPIVSRVLPAVGLGSFGGPFRYSGYRRDRSLITSVGS